MNELLNGQATKPISPKDTKAGYSSRLTAAANWDRYQYGKDRGHLDYCRAARKFEDFYVGGKGQWTDADLQFLAEQGRPAHTFNLIKPKINTAIGYQIQNRMDIALKPRGEGVDEEQAKTMTKVIMQIADNTSLHWKETEVFSDGLIQQRGYFDIRVDYSDSLLGEVKITTLDPLDVIPDPDSKSYDPDDWKDVTIARWMELDEIEAEYGTEARNKVAQQNYSDRDFGELDDDELRNKFGADITGGEYHHHNDDQIKRVQVIERQFWEYTQADVLISMTGDIRLANEVSDSEMNRGGFISAKRRIRRIRWLVTTQTEVIFDEWSPFTHFTIVPYFPFFRRGKTSGLVEDAISAQELFNKTMSQYMHIINTAANSGWIYWSNTLANMTDAEFALRGGENGLTIALKQETPPDRVPQKISSVNVPTAFERVMERASILLGDTLGINEAMSGQMDRDISGVAAQALQFAAQQGLAVPLDNLGRTRNLVARRIVDLVQRFYDEPRVMRITDTDQVSGREQDTMTQLNAPQEDGSILNDLTMGEYDIVISEQAMAITFQNSQFEQALSMREKGIAIPDSTVLRYSSLADKHDIIDAMQQQQQTEPDMEAKIALLQAQTKKTEAETVNKMVEAQYSAGQTANAIAAVPQTAALADALLRSAGYQDQDAAPIVPQPEQAIPEADANNPANTNPLTPANPGVGMQAGIETPENDPEGGIQ